MTAPALSPSSVDRKCPTCDYSGRYKTASLADYHFPRHSCALTQERRDRVSRSVTREAAAGARRDCTCARAHHEHGTPQGYSIDRCRCYDCKVARRLDARRQRRQRAYGKTPYVDAQPVREHLQQLMAAGMGARRIAEVAQVNSSTLSRITYGRPSSDPAEYRPPSRRLAREMAATLLSVELDLADGAHTSSVGTSRRLQSLVAVGWSQAKLAQEVGIHAANFPPIVHGRRDVTRRTAEAVAALYDRLWDQKPDTSTPAQLSAYRRSLRYAAEHQWLPPLAWDDDVIDDPQATPHQDQDQDLPDEVLVQRALSGQRVQATRAERRIIIDRWRSSGRFLAELDRIQGWNVHRDVREAS